MKMFFGAAVLTAAMLLGAASASAAVTLYAGYDDYNDSSFFRLTTDAAGLQNVQITGTNSNGTTTFGGISGNFAANFDTGRVLFGDGDYKAFQYDYDDYVSGEASYTISALYNGHSVSAVFSPSSNLSGTFVGFLGNDSNGYEWDANIGDTAVAQLSAAVPEPGTWAMMIVGLAATGMMLRHRKTAAVAA